MSETVTITFQYENGEKIELQAHVGENLLDIAREHDLNIDGSCGGCCACSTCHVWIEDPWFNKLPPASTMEEDQLDNAQQIGPYSRLCCQLTVTKDMDNAIITIPQSSSTGAHHHHD